MANQNIMAQEYEAGATHLMVDRKQRREGSGTRYNPPKHVALTYSPQGTHSKVSRTSRQSGTRALNMEVYGGQHHVTQIECKNTQQSVIDP